MVNEKRKHRAYKMKDKPYEKAMKRAGKEKKHLATLIELWVEEYSKGAEVNIYMVAKSRVQSYPPVKAENLKKIEIWK